VTISSFNKRVVIEQIRYMEVEEMLACDTEEILAGLSGHGDFEHRLWRRAQCLLDRYDLRPVLGRAARLSRHTNTVALTVAALLGVLGIICAVTDSFTINIYWLLLVLLGFNFISMLLWLTGISLNMGGLIAGALARLASRLPGHIESKNRFGTQADRAWLACHYAGDVGKWQLSKITHQLWLAYLFAGLICLVLLLMVRQYDFVWGTTLLSDAAFIKLTEVLSKPLEVSGLVVPSADQVQETRIGVAQFLTAGHRYHWAQFLLGALLCFGIVPRILLWCWSAVMCAHARRHFTLDYYLPYYVNLRQQLMPLASHDRFIDARDASPVVSATPATKPVSHTLPADTQWVAVELGDKFTWPPASINSVNNLGQVVDRKSLTHILQHIQSTRCSGIAVAVLSVRAPDRGVQRTIDSLMAGSEQRWLVLLQTREQEPVSSTRLAAWYRVAEMCKVPADHVISLSVD
jgi:hypothetical protein